MGLRIRKSINIGPLRINFSTSGVSFSIGVKGFRISRSVKGKTSATVSISGTGISYVESLDKNWFQKLIAKIKAFFVKLTNKGE